MYCHFVYILKINILYKTSKLKHWMSVSYDRLLIAECLQISFILPSNNGRKYICISLCTIMLVKNMGCIHNDNICIRVDCFKAIILNLTGFSLILCAVVARYVDNGTLIAEYRVTS